QLGKVLKLSKLSKLATIGVHHRDDLWIRSISYVLLFQRVPMSPQNLSQLSPRVYRPLRSRVIFGAQWLPNPGSVVVLKIPERSHGRNHLSYGLAIQKSEGQVK